MGEKDNGKRVSVRKVRNRMMICYTIVTAMLFFAAFTYAFVNLKSIVYKECEEDITALGRQYATAVNRFTKGVENDTSALFTVNELPEYDPVKGGLSPADESELKNSTKEMLLKMSAGKTYVDFMIFYSDGSVIGKASSGTNAALNTESYEYFNDQMKNGECWLFGLSGANRKIYYIRRLSDHSVLLLSEYIDELDKIINSENGQKQIFILTDEQQRVIYTTADEKKLKHGDAIPKKYSSMFDAENEHVTVNGLTGAKLTTDSGWTAYTIMEQPSLIKISPIDGPSAMAMLLILVLISVATGTLATAKFMAGELADTNSEFIDPATGVLNEYGLDEKISELMETSIIGSTYALVLLSIKDAAGIRSTVTYSCWNDTRVNAINIIKEYFGEKAVYIGRISEDRIAAFVNFSEFDIFKAHEAMNTVCGGLPEAFEEFTLGGESDMKLYVSIGVCCYPDHAEDFSSLISKAAEAMKEAEQAEGNSAAFYKPEKSKEGAAK